MPHLFIITGASRGMGLAIAQQLLIEGHELLCISRQLNEELASSAARGSVPLTQWQGDLVDAAVIATRLRGWLQARHTADSATLINNAGVIPAIAPLSQVSAGGITRALRVGVEAPMLLAGAFLQETALWRVPKKVLNISSGLGRRAMASQAAYCAAKAAMDHFTRCLALEEAHKAHGAKVCSLAPGVIDTDMQVQLRSADQAQFPDKAAFTDMKDKGVLISPQEAADRVVAYLQRADFGSNPVADVRDIG
jgi:benzil reductase ((S)-benzoin forming)